MMNKINWGENMNRIVIVALLFAISSVSAQQSTPTPEEIDARTQALAAQRDEANNRIVLLAGQWAKERAALTAEIEKAKKEAAVCKPVAEEKKK